MYVLDKLIYTKGKDTKGKSSKQNSDSNQPTVTKQKGNDSNDGNQQAEKQCQE